MSVGIAILIYVLCMLVAVEPDFRVPRRRGVRGSTARYGRSRQRAPSAPRSRALDGSR